MERNTQNTPSPEAMQKKRFRGNVLFTTGGLLIYFAIVNFIAVAAVMVRTIFIAATVSSQAELQEKTAELQGMNPFTMAVMIVGTLIGVGFMFLFFIKREPPKQLFAKRNKATPLKILMMASVIMGMQLIFSLGSMLAETLFNLVGLSLEKSIESSTANNTGIMEIIYVGLLAPILEEIVFRGFVMHGLNKFGGGKVFAIIVSSILFGAYHQNPTQSIFTIFIGLVFAYAAMEYGLICSIALHMINNLVFGEILTYLIGFLPEESHQIAASLALQGVFLVVSIIIIIFNSKRLKTFIQENRTPAKFYGWTFSTVTVIVFIAINMLFALMLIQKL